MSCVMMGRCRLVSVDELLRAARLTSDECPLVARNLLGLVAEAPLATGKQLDQAVELLRGHPGRIIPFLRRPRV